MCISVTPPRGEESSLGREAGCPGLLCLRVPGPAPEDRAALLRLTGLSEKFLSMEAEGSRGRRPLSLCQSHSSHLALRVQSWSLHPVYFCAENTWLFSPCNSPSPFPSPLSPGSWLSPLPSLLFQPSCCSLLVAQPAPTGPCLTFGQLTCLCH